MKSNFEGHIDLKNHFDLKNIPSPLSPHYAASKAYVDNQINDPSIMQTLHMLTSMEKISLTFVLLR